MIYIGIIIIILLSALFSGLEIAFVSSDKIRLEIDIKQKKWYALIIHRFVKIPQKFIATLIIANNIALVIYGILAANLLEKPLLHFIHNTFLLLILQTIISSLIILFFGEFLPKSLFRIKANTLLYFFAVPTLIIYYTFYPITHFFIGLSNLFIRLFFKKHRSQQGEYIISKADIQELIKQNIEQNADEENYELKIFQNALNFDQVKVKECIIPRTEIAAVDVNSNIQQIKEMFIETGYSKLIVYQENIDHIIGYIHIGDIFNEPTDIKNIIREIIIAPETLPAKKLLSEFIQKKKSIALVVDEFGGTAGIVTIEDILEEIFGEINDEHDINEFIEKQINENEFVFSGRLEIDYINEKYHLNIPESQEYETLAGFILYYHHSIPKTNEIINIQQFAIKIIKSTNTKIDVIELKKITHD
ncbi:MAG: hemolysin family protein [Bacteroidales bacterium]|nr:hemolysin family protein [Bacteroidales bacterium]